MADLLRGTPAPPVPMPARSNAPKVVTKEVVIERTLKGKDGKDGVDGADGKDGKEAFPDGLLVFSVLYKQRPSVPGERRRGEVELRSSTMPVGLESTDDGYVLPAGRKYRITVTPELGGEFAPAGTSIALLDGPVYLNNMVPAVIKVPLFLNRLPDFRLAVYAEYMKDGE